MSIAEKLQTIAENEQKVYQAGYENGNTEGYTKGQGEGYKQGYDAGALPMYYVRDIASLYSNVAFPEGTELLVRIKTLGSSVDIGYVFYKTTGVKSIKFVVEEESLVPASFAFRETCAEIVDLSECALKFRNAIYLFYNATKLKSIYGAFDFSNITATPTSWLDGCKLLENMEFVKETIKVDISLSLPVASDKTIQSFIDGLADLTGGTAKKATFHTNIITKLTDEQLSQISAKNWTIG